MTELRIRVKDHIKELLEDNKEKFGASISFQVNFAIHKYLVLDTKADINLMRAMEREKMPHLTTKGDYNPKVQKGDKYGVTFAP